jgi:hypothetical protein
VNRVVQNIAAILLLAVAGACAHVEAPRGGPDMRDTLRLAAVLPDSLAVVPDLRGPVVFAFERRLSERGLDDAVLVSPRTSPVVVGHRGRELRVALREGWAPGHIYMVTVTPTIQDLWNNRLLEPVTHVFSTGPAIPDTRLAGQARDRLTGRAEVDIRVEAIRQPDSLVYATRTDSAGAFVFAHVPEGPYLVRAFRDMNRNRALDPFEPFDTAVAQLAAADTAEVRLSVVMPDTTPPQVASAEIAQQTIQVRFDDHLDPAQELSPAQVQIIGPDGATVPVSRLAVGQLEAAREGEEDAPDAQPAPAVPPVPGGPPVPGAPRRGDAPGPQERLPSQTLSVEPAEALAPETEYRIRVEGVRNVVGLVGGGETTITTPAAAPARAPAPPDDPDEPDAEPDPDPDPEP